MHKVLRPIDYDKPDMIWLFTDASPTATCPWIGIVFVTGRGGAGFHFVTPPVLRPGVNSLLFLPAPYDTGPWPGCGAGRVFYFPR